MDQTTPPAATNETADQQKQQQDAVKASIQAKYDNKITAMPVSFSFKSVDVIDPVTEKPEMVKDEKTGKETVKKYRRPTLSLILPLISMEGVVAVLESGDEKQQALLLQALQDVQIQRARELISENESITQESFPLDQISWPAIANLPQAERRGGGISKDTWEAFAKDYLEVMPAALNKPTETIQKHTQILLNKFQLVRDKKPVLQLMQSNLGVYAQTSPNAEQYQECLEFLNNKAEQFLKLDPSEYLQNL